MVDSNSRKKYTIKDCQKIAKARGGACLSTEYINLKSKLIWRCKNGHTWKTTFGHIKYRNQWCAKCKGCAKYTIEDCKKLAIKNNGICLSKKYQDIYSKLSWKCSKNHVWSTCFRTIVTGHWCPHCAGIIKKTINDARNLAKIKGGKFLSTKYINCDTKYSWQCSQGHIWETTYDHVNNGTWCPYCANNVRLTLQDCIDEATKKNGQCLSDTYTNSITKMKWKCSKGHIWKATFGKIKIGHWCHICGGSNKLTLADCHKAAKTRKGKCLSKTYINTKTKLVWECEKGHKWKSSLFSIKTLNTWCPICLYKNQRIIFNVCKEIFPKYTIKYNYRGFSWLKTDKCRSQEIDIFIPKIKLAIEYDGAQHFKPTTFFCGSLRQAQINFKNQQRLDKLKNKKISQHPEDVKYFIRFNYKDKLTKNNIVEKIKKVINE